MLSNGISQCVPSAQDEVGSFDGEEAFRQDAPWTGVGRKQRAQSLDGGTRPVLAQSVFDRTAKVFFVQSVDDDSGHTRFLGFAREYALQWLN
jgi:hypothetical protein